MKAELPIKKSKKEIEFYQKYCTIFGDILYTLYNDLKQSKINAPLELEKRYTSLVESQWRKANDDRFLYCHYPFSYQKNHLGNEFINKICVSVNDVIAHGIPTNKEFQLGDVISVDLGLALHIDMRLLNFDSAFTVVYGEKEQPDWVLATRQALCNILDTQVKNVFDTAVQIYKTAKEYNLYVVTELTGHGIGYELHEEPRIRNVPGMYSNTDFFEGLVFCAEPVYVLPDGNNDGNRIAKIHIDSDGWSIRTNSSQPGSHFETMFAIIDGTLVDLCGITKWKC